MPAVGGDGDHGDAHDIAHEHPAERRDYQEKRPHPGAAQIEDEEEAASHEGEEGIDAGARFLDEEAVAGDFDDVAGQLMIDAEKIQDPTAAARGDGLHRQNQAAIETEGKRHGHPQEEPSRKLQAQERPAAGAIEEHGEQNQGRDDP